MVKIMCKIFFKYRNINKKINMELDYKLDCTMYNGNYITSNDVWLRNKTSIFRDTRNKVHPIHM